MDATTATKAHQTSYIGLPAGSLFKRAEQALSHGIISPRDAFPGDLVGVRLRLRRNEDGIFEAYIAQAFLIMKEDGSASSLPFTKLPPPDRTDAALLTTWLHWGNICEGLDLDWDMEVFARACGSLPPQTYELTLLSGLALLTKEGSSDTLKRFDNLANRGQTQRACDEVRRILLPEPDSAHGTMALARLFDAKGIAAYQAVIDSVAEEGRSPHRVRPIALPNIRGYLASLRAGR